MCAGKRHTEEGEVGERQRQGKEIQRDRETGQLYRGAGRQGGDIQKDRETGQLYTVQRSREVRK